MPIEALRPRVAHVPGILQCLAGYHFHVLGISPVADPDFSGESILTVRNAISHVDLERKSWIAARDDELLGFCCWDWQDEKSRVAKTVLISVVPQERSAGVGAILQNRRLDEMREHGAREVHTFSDDPKAIHWYQERFGYHLIGYEPVHHCLHRFYFGELAYWGIHRGFPDRYELAHLRLELSS